MSKTRRITINLILLIIILGIMFAKPLKYKLTRAINLATIEDFFDEHKYREVADLLNKIEREKGLEQESIKLFRKLAYEGIALTLYAKGVDLLKEEQYAEAKECLEQLDDFIMGNSKLLNIDYELYASYFVEIGEEILDRPDRIITLGELNSIRKKYKEKIQEAIQGEDNIQITGVLIDSITGKLFCDAMMEEK